MWVSVKEKLPKETGRYKIRNIKGIEENIIFMSQFQAFLYDKKILEWWED